jgi:L-idonate 5-dehydrogenase
MAGLLPSLPGPGFGATVSALAMAPAPPGDHLLSDAARPTSDDNGRPLRLRCLCLVIQAPDELQLVSQEAEALAAGQVLVQVGFGGICGSDLHYFHAGGFGTVRIKRPMILGHEVAGTVTAVAPDVSRVKPGDKVAVNPSRPCSSCRYCLEGLPNHCLDMRFYGSAMRDPHVEGAFRSLLVCDAVQCEPVAAGVPLQHAALAEPLSVALHGVQRAGPLLGKRVLVSGCGPIGALAVAAARVHGAAEITAVDLTDETLAVARAMGAQHTINVVSDSGWVPRYSADKGTFDVMFECSGSEAALRAGLDTMRPRGVVVQLGLGGDVQLPQNLVVSKELNICGSFRFHTEFALAVRLINEGRVDMGPMITGAFPLEQAREAFELASDRKRAMKVLLDFTATPAAAAFA